MPDPEVRKIKKRMDALKHERANAESDWREIEKYCYPAATQYSFPRHEHINEADRYELFDGTGVLALNLLSRSMHSSITPPNYPWIDFKLTKNGEDVISEDVPIGDERRQITSQRTKIVRAEFNYSNFDKECSNLYKNVIGYGLGCLFSEMIFDRRRNISTLHFESISPWELFPIQNDQGMVDSTIRAFKMTAMQIDQHWPDAKKDPDAKNLQNKLDKNPDDLMDVLHYVKPDGNGNYAYSSEYILLDDTIWLKRGGKGFRTFPYHYLFWERVRNKVYANSPAMDAISDIKALNEMVKVQFEAYEKFINGVWAVEQSNLINGELDVGSRSVNIVEDINGIRNFMENARFDVAEHLIQSLRDRIQKIFYIDQIQLPPMEGTPHTATEIQVRVEFQLRILGPMFGAHKFDFLNSMTERVYQLLHENQRFPELPIMEDDEDIEPIYIGPLAKAQKLNQVTATERLMVDYINILAQYPQIAQARPEILYLFDWLKVFQEKANATGVPQTVFLEPRERKEKVEEYKQMQQQQQMSETMQTDSQTAKNMATAEKMINGG